MPEVNYQAIATFNEEELVALKHDGLILDDIAACSVNMTTSYCEQAHAERYAFPDSLADKCALIGRAVSESEMEFSCSSSRCPIGYEKRFDVAFNGLVKAIESAQDITLGVVVVQRAVRDRATSQM